jgi:cell wall-associated NlpC family hydrolase
MQEVRESQGGVFLSVTQKVSLWMVVALLLIATLVGCNRASQDRDGVRMQATQQVPIAANATPEAQKVIAAGSKYLGVPYEFGSDRKTTTTFDCSDFVRTAFWEGLRLKLPFDSRTQADYVRKVGRTNADWRSLQPGDIMFFMSYRGSKAGSYSGINKSAQRITHDGIYLGNGKMLHTYSKESGGVRVDNIAGKHWGYRFIFGGSAIR